MTPALRMAYFRRCPAFQSECGHNSPATIFDALNVAFVSDGRTARTHVDKRNQVDRAIQAIQVDTQQN